MIPEYKRWLERNYESEETRKNYLAKATFFLSWLTPASCINSGAEVDRETVHRFMEYLLVDRKAKPSTRVNYILALRVYFDFLIVKGLSKINPAMDIPLPKLRQIPPGSLSEDEISRMLFAAFEEKNERGLRDIAVISFLAATGCRTGALTRLRLSDFQSIKIHMPDRCGHCSQPILGGKLGGRGHEVSATQVVIKEKGGGSWPVILHERAAFYLSHYLQDRKTGVGTDIVFAANRNGKVGPMQRSGIREMLSRRAKQAGINKHITPHAFRHTAITYWLDAGVDPETVQRFVGHKNLRTTMQYRHKSMRSFTQAGIARGRNPFDGSIKTPMDAILDKVLS